MKKAVRLTLTVQLFLFKNPVNFLKGFNAPL